ncbi:MAG: DNA-binding response regulator [Frankiales bacterium]|nr:DNA-binding response regulator [Frankiales bacterium]
MDDGGMGARVLVVEDDPTLGGGLVATLAASSYEVRWARDCAQARALMTSGPADLVLLDLGLPDGDGVELCRQIRALDNQVVVVVVTARTDEADAVLALDAGADDYVAKPFRTVELLARLRAHLRRRDALGQPDLRVGRTRLDLRARRAWVGEAELPLRPKEFELLVALASTAGTAVRREQLMDDVWDEHWEGSTKTLDVHVANLRRKLADAGERWDRIATLRGFGYRFELD